MNGKNKKYMYLQKSELTAISLSDIDMELPDLKNISEAKSVAIARWLAKWIERDLKACRIEETNIIPSKSEFAYLLGVSIGTMQNAFRQLEDWGYVESKQCVGTIIRDYKEPVSNVRKLVSKRELAAEAIKRYIKTDGFKKGAILPSSRTLATITGYTPNTTRMALDFLENQGVLSHFSKNGKEQSWVLETEDFEIRNITNSQAAETLVDMVVRDLEAYIVNNLKVGDKMPSHAALSTELKASIKTIHDALQVLIGRGILLARRGRYGTSVVRIPGAKVSSLKPETSIFASAEETAFYHYEKTQNHIKKMIAQDYEIGDKLPSIQELANQLDLSPNTIRKAFHNLAKEGYLVFSRGRYGGTFVIDIPEIDAQTFKWLAVNPEFAKQYQEGVN